MINVARTNSPSSKKTYNTSKKELMRNLELSEQENFYHQFFGESYRPDKVVDFKKLYQDIKRILQEEPYAFYDRWHFKDTTPLDVCRSYADNPPKDFSFTSLFREEHIGRLKSLLKLLDPEELYQNFGVHVILRLWRVPSPYDAKYDPIYKQYEDILIQHLCDGDTDRYDNLCRLFFAHWRMLRSSDFYTIIKNWDLINSLPLGNLVDSDTVYGVETLADYHLELLSTKDNQYEFGPSKNRSNREIGYEWHDVYLDGPVALSLFHHDKPVASVSFLFKKGDVLFINQLQRHVYKVFDIHGRVIKEERDRSLAQIDWKSLLVDKVVKHAMSKGAKEVVIQSGENNVRTQRTRDNKHVPKDTIPHLDSNLAKKIYDDYAATHGYTQDPQDKNWHKFL